MTMAATLTLLPPIALTIAGLVAARTPGKRPVRAAVAGEALTVTALCASLAAVVLASLGLSGSLALPGAGASILAVRADAVSLTMLTLVAFIGWVVYRYARRYLDGEDRQGAFLASLAATLASVMTLVIAGSLPLLVLAWIATSFFLRKLLLFYPERAGARRGARKKFAVSRASEASLALAALLLFAAYGTGNIGAILDAAREGDGGWMAGLAAFFLALAALLKSAQFPFHGWLTDVMETPTPVSALLHAGVINAGGFLLIRFADVMLLQPAVLAGLVVAGGFTALFGSLAMLAQPAVKTSLAWSTIAQMGFMVLQCGLALFPLALLHIAAHSLYKAHAFLASGSAVETVAANRRPGPVAIPGARAVAQAFGLAIVVYALMQTGAGFLFGFDEKPAQAVALGAIMIFGVAYLVAQGLADAAPRELTMRTLAYSAAVSASYILLQAAARVLTDGTLPATPAPTALEWFLLAFAVATFGLVAVAQAAFPHWSTHPAAAGLRVHLANGLYANTLFDRLSGGFRTAN